MQFSKKGPRGAFFPQTSAFEDNIPLKRKTSDIIAPDIGLANSESKWTDYSAPELAHLLIVKQEVHRPKVRRPKKSRKTPSFESKTNLDASDKGLSVLDRDYEISRQIVAFTELLNGNKPHEVTQLLFTNFTNTEIEYVLFLEKLSEDGEHLQLM